MARSTRRDSWKRPPLQVFEETLLRDGVSAKKGDRIVNSITECREVNKRKSRTCGGNDGIEGKKNSMKVK
jgi:hypothetical protein